MDLPFAVSVLRAADKCPDMLFVSKRALEEMF
jgi:hypothetical protein